MKFLKRLFNIMQSYWSERGRVGKVSDNNFYYVSIASACGKVKNFMRRYKLNYVLLLALGYFIGDLVGGLVFC